MISLKQCYINSTKKIQAMQNFNNRKYKAKINKIRYKNRNKQTKSSNLYIFNIY